MGECAYFLKAEFPSDTIAENKKSVLDNFFSQMQDAYDFYQSNRGGDAGSFWKDFSTLFPVVWRYVLSFEPQALTCPITCLYGKLDVGDSKDLKFQVWGSVVSWEASYVWHFADWTYLTKFIEKEFGAIKSVASSEEVGCGSIDGLNLYEWEDIVRNILKNTAVLPLLINTHPDLDILIETQLKKDREG